MNHCDEPNREMHALFKALILALVGLFVIIGLVGLVLPIIPGILFLVVAAWLLAKVSGRFASHLDQHRGWQRGRRIWRQSQGLSLAQRVKLSLLLIARSMVDKLK